MDVGNSIVELLKRELTPEPIDKPEKVGLCSPNEPEDFQLTVHLYHIEENGNYRQNDMMIENKNRMRYPPLSLKLHYLITAHSKGKGSAKSEDEGRILGRVMQCLYDHSVIESNLLQGSLKEQEEGIRIAFNQMSYDELQRIWAYPNKPYKLSLSYMVEPVLLNSTRTRNVKRVTDVRVQLNQKGDFK
jgi:hypothetical protein